MAKLKDMKIQKRLTTSFIMVSFITAFAAIVGVVAMIVIATRLLCFGRLTEYQRNEG